MALDVAVIHLSANVVATSMLIVWNALMPRFNIATATNPTIAMKAQLQTDSPTVARGARTSAAGGAEGFVGVFGLGLNARDPAVPGVAGGVGVVGSADFGVFEGVTASDNLEPKLRTGDSQPLPGVSGEERLEPLPKRGVSGEAASSSGVVNSSFGM